MIVPNCRQHIQERDLAFALGLLQGPTPDTGGVAAEDVDLDELLDSREVFNALVRSRDLLSVSPYFFYYVLVRQVFMRRGISDRSVADYVGALLSYFMRGEKLRGETQAGTRGFVYLVDLVDCARRAPDDQAAFVMEARIGDVALFLTGVFPDAIYHRQTYGRRLPGLEYYEAVGRSGYRSASRHPPSRHRDLGEVLEFMAAEFAAVRKALNDLSDTHFCMTRSRVESLDRIMRQALYGTRGQAAGEGRPGEEEEGGEEDGGEPGQYADGESSDA
ncbi:MAG: hypothetical protein H0V09_04675 [Gemmatimonadetes bacterium]|nr:hypothetical protein [Gemmatimonadota bacterium]